MVEMILESTTLPEPIFNLIDTQRVRVVQGENGEVNLTPVASADEERHPLRGFFKDCGFTVDEFLAWKREDKRLEDEKDERRWAGL